MPAVKPQRSHTPKGHSARESRHCRPCRLSTTPSNALPRTRKKAHWWAPCPGDLHQAQTLAPSSLCPAAIPWPSRRNPPQKHMCLMRARRRTTDDGRKTDESHPNTYLVGVTVMAKASFKAFCFRKRPSRPSPSPPPTMP